jgi:tetratricopeptide (TPR) repeat protein
MVPLAITLQWTLPFTNVLMLLIVGFILLAVLRGLNLIPRRYAMVGRRALVIGCIAGTLVMWLTHPPTEQVHRLAILPALPGTAVDAPAGFGYGLAHLTVDLLRDALPKNSRITPIDIVSSVIEKKQPTDLNAVLKVCADVGARYAVFGTYNQDQDSTVVLQMYFVTVGDSTVTTQPFRIHPDSLSFTPVRLAGAIQQHFSSFADLTLPQKKNLAPDAFVWYCQGQAMYQRHTPEGYWDAAEAYRNAMAHDSTSAWPYFGLAQVYQKWKRAEYTFQTENAAMRRKAIAHSRTALLLQPGLTEAYRIMASTYQALRRWEEQSISLKQAIAADPADPWNFAALSHIRPERFEDMGFDNEARVGEKAVQLNTDAVLLHTRLIRSYLSAGELYDALDFAKQAFDANADLYDVLLAAGKAYEYNARPHNAIDMYTRAIALDPKNQSAYIGLADAYSLKGDSEKAVETYESAIRRLPQHADLYYSLAILHQRHGHWEKAVPYFEQAIEVDQHVDSYFYMARWYEKQGDRQKATEFWQQRILRGDPREEWTRKAMTQLRLLSPSAVPTIGVNQ